MRQRSVPAAAMVTPVMSSTQRTISLILAPFSACWTAARQSCCPVPQRGAGTGASPARRMAIPMSFTMSSSLKASSKVRLVMRCLMCV